ncbi:unnamed protein product [Caretta caretta]
MSPGGRQSALAPRRQALRLALFSLLREYAAFKMPSVSDQPLDRLLSSGLERHHCQSEGDNLAKQKGDVGKPSQLGNRGGQLITPL